MAASNSPKDRFDALYVQAQSESQRLVPIIEEMNELGKILNMHYQRKVPFKKVAPHRHNRDGQVISGAEAMKIWNDVDKVGVSSSLWLDATAFEELPSRPNEKRFLELCKCDPHLASYVEGEIEVASVACSHWNQALASAEGGKVLYK